MACFQRSCFGRMLARKEDHFYVRFAIGSDHTLESLGRLRPSWRSLPIRRGLPPLCSAIHDFFSPLILLVKTT